MKVRASRTTYDEVELADHVQLKVARSYLRKTFDLPEGALLLGTEVWIEYEVGYGSHSGWEKRFYRNATPVDAERLAAMDILRV